MVVFPENLLDIDIRDPRFSRKKSRKYFWCPMLFSNRVSKQCLALLNENMLKHVRTYQYPIPADSIERMKENYSEQLGKTFKSKIAILNNPRSPASKAAADIGLLSMMRSSHTREFAEKICGFELAPDPGCQVICYSEGDQAGPHNDHHPEDDNLKDGYVDLHITFCDPGVDHQFLVHEEKGYLSKITNVAAPNGISVSLLPFWHYVTPLVTKAKMNNAKRWLVLVSFEKC